VLHGHDGGDEEGLVADLGDHDDGEGGEEGVEEAERDLGHLVRVLGRVLVPGQFACATSERQ